MKTPEQIMLEFKWTFDSDPARYSMFLGLIKPAIELAQLEAYQEGHSDAMRINMSGSNEIYGQ